MSGSQFEMDDLSGYMKVAGMHKVTSPIDFSFH
jgi:hypothetical protein